MSIINKLFRKKWFPLGIQIVTLIAFLFLVIGGIVANTNDMVLAKILRNTNLANLIVWSYWWPFIIIGSIFLGRVWCMICPIEMVTSFSARIGLKHKTPRWFCSGWVITVFYIIILFMGIHTFAIHRVPFRMAVYLLTLFVVAVITGLVFEKNAFCSYVCPVAHLLGLYARIAPFGWRVRDRSVCKECKDKSCISKKNLYHFQAKSCGVNLVPAKIADNTHCLLCGQCVKACDKYNPGLTSRPNPGWFVRTFAKDLLSLKPINIAQVVFVLVVSGFVVYELFTEWDVTKNILFWFPNLIQSQLALQGSWATGFIQSITLFLFLPVLIWLLPFGLYRIAKKSLSLLSYLQNFGIAFIPVMAAAHLIKAVLKTTSRLPYWSVSLNDPIGMKSAQAVLDKSIILFSNPVWLSVVISILALFILLVGTVLSARIIKKLAREKFPEQEGGYIFYFIPAIYGGLFMIMIIVWRLSFF